MDATQAKSRRFAGCFVIGIVSIMALSHTVPSLRRQYAADHSWPSAWGTVMSYEERSRVVHDSDGPDTTVYRIEFWVTLDLPLDQCHTLDRFLIDARTQCMARIETPELSSWAKAQEWIDRRPRNSTAQVHDDPQGPEVKFAGESILNVYPWKEIAVEFGALIVGLLFWRAGRIPNSNSPGLRAEALSGTEAN
jgi:hypothetical protein